MICTRCEEDTGGRAFLCDESDLGLRCHQCFDLLDCEEKHGEGCMTVVYDDGKET